MFSTRRGVALRTINGWRSYGGAYGKLTVEKTATLCFVSGLLKGSRWGRPMAKLPKGCRPKGRLIFNMNNHQSTARVDVLKNGKIVWVAGGHGHGWISLSGISVPRIAKRRGMYGRRRGSKKSGGTYGLRRGQRRKLKLVITCKCSTPGSGTVGKNQYKCTDGVTSYCARTQECYARTPFPKGKWFKGCRTPLRRTFFTPARGGTGGKPVRSYCKAGTHINFWQIRSGALSSPQVYSVDLHLQLGRCNCLCCTVPSLCVFLDQHSISVACVALTALGGTPCRSNPWPLQQWSVAPQMWRQRWPAVAGSHKHPSHEG